MMAARSVQRRFSCGMFRVPDFVAGTSWPDEVGPPMARLSHLFILPLSLVALLVAPLAGPAAAQSPQTEKRIALGDRRRRLRQRAARHRRQ